MDQPSQGPAWNLAQRMALKCSWSAKETKASTEASRPHNGMGRAAPTCRWHPSPAHGQQYLCACCPVLSPDPAREAYGVSQAQLAGGRQVRGQEVKGVPKGPGRAGGSSTQPWD